MANLNSYNRVHLIKVLRANPEHLPENVLRYSKDELVKLCQSIKGLDLSVLDSCSQIKQQKEKKEIVKGVSNENVKSEVKQPVKPLVKRVVLNELSDLDEPEEEDEVEEKVEVKSEPIPIPKPKVSRLVRTKISVEPVKQVVKVPIKVPVKQVLQIQDNKHEEGDVKQVLKNYVLDVRSLLELYNDIQHLDEYDVEDITNKYNEIRETTENNIEQIADSLEHDFDEKFYKYISNTLDTQLNKIKKFLE